MPAGWRLLAGASCFALALQAAPLAAQTAGGAEGEGNADAEILVTGSRYYPSVTDSATRLPLSIIDTPQSIGFVTEELIRDVGAVRLEDVIERVSGVQKSTNNFGVYRQTIIRGFQAANRHSYKEDGFTYINQIDLDLVAIERIEVLKGPASIGFGVAVPGGIVNRVTKKPLRESLFEVRGEVGSYDFRRAEIDMGGALDGSESVRFRLTGAVQSVGSHVDFIKNDRIFLSPVVDIDLGSRTLLRLNANYMREDGQPDNGLPLFTDGTFPQVPISQSGSSEDSLFGVEAWNVSALLQHRFSSDVVANVRLDRRQWKRLIVNGYVYQGGGIEIVDDPDLPGAQNAPSTFVYSRDDVLYNVWSVDANVTANFSLFGRQNTVVVGVDHSETQQYAYFTYAYAPENIDILNRDTYYSQTIPDEYFAFSDRDRIYANKFTNIYTNLVLRPVENLTVLLSGNYSIIKDGADPDTRADYSKFVPRVGLTYAVTPEINVYASYSKGFFTNEGLDRDFRTLAPSDATQWEVGAKAAFFDSKFTVTGALYRIDRTNISDNDPDCGPGGLCPNPQASRLIGSRRHQGVEFDVVGSPIPGLNVIGTLSYIDPKITDAADPAWIGGRPRNVARWNGSFFGSYELQSGALKGFGFGGGPVYQGSRFVDDFSGSPGEVLVDGYTRWDALLFYRGIEKVDITLNLNNITDERRAIAGQPNFNNGSYRQQPFTATLSVSFKL